MLPSQNLAVVLHSTAGYLQPSSQPTIATATEAVMLPPYTQTWSRFGFLHASWSFQLWFGSDPTIASHCSLNHLLWGWMLPQPPNSSKSTHFLSTDGRAPNQITRSVFVFQMRRELKKMHGSQRVVFECLHATFCTVGTFIHRKLWRSSQLYTSESWQSTKNCLVTLFNPNLVTTLLQLCPHSTYRINIPTTLIPFQELHMEDMKWKTDTRGAHRCR